MEENNIAPNPSMGNAMPKKSVNVWMIVAIIFILIIIGLGVYGFITISNMNNKISNLNNQVTDLQNKNKALEDAGGTSTNPTESTKLNIKELGIEISLPQDINDLVYNITNEGGNTFANLSTKSLIELDPDCNARGGPLGALGKIKGEYDKSAAPGKLVKQFNGYYIVHTPMQGCPNGFKDEVNALYNKQARALELKSTYESVQEF